MLRRAMVVITDGQDNDSRYSMRQLSKLLKELDEQVIAISVYSDPPGAGVFAKSIREDAVALVKDLASKPEDMPSFRRRPRNCFGKRVVSWTSSGTSTYSVTALPVA
jgi:hypothetical protein